MFSEIEQVLRDAADRIGPAVIGLGRGWGHGSGVVVADGLALAALHGAGGGRRGRGRGRGDRFADERDTRTPAATFPDGRTVATRVAGRDPATGLAVLELDTGGVDPVPAITDGAGPGIGTAVIALGNPGGRGLRVTHGFVASRPRPVEGPRGRAVEGAFEHTAPLPRGSAGGPVVGIDGRLLGVSVFRPSPGLILALATGADVAARAGAVARGDILPPRTIGVALAPAHVARRLRRAVGLPEVDGLLVRGVDPGSPAEAAGFAVGDLVTHAGETPATDVGVLAAAIDATPSGASLTLRVLRGTEERLITVVPSPGGAR